MIPEPYWNWERIKVHNNFTCEQNITVCNPYDCRGCKYFYKNSYGGSCCLKEQVKYWCLYHIEQEEES